MFVTPVVLGVGNLPGIWTVWQDATWQDAKYGRVVLPRGFLTDLASTPQFLRAFGEFDPTGISRRPAAFHDGAYARLFGWDKDKADSFLRDAMLSEGAAADVAERFYQGVHIFGQSHWDDDAGAIAGKDFDTQEHFMDWKVTAPGTQP
jgi:hypothetical protein